MDALSVVKPYSRKYLWGKNELCSFHVRKPHRNASQTFHVSYKQVHVWLLAAHFTKTMQKLHLTPMKLGIFLCKCNENLQTFD